MRVNVVIAIIVTALLIGLVVLMSAVSIWKIAEDGWTDFFQHYTNWSWTLQTIYYALLIPAPLIVALGITDWRLRLQMAVIALFFVPLWGIVVAVLLMVILMLLTGAEFIDSIAQSVPLSILVLGNEMFHFLTVLILLTVTLILQRITYDSLNEVFSQPPVHKSRLIFWGLVFYEMVGGPLISVLLYLSIFNPQVVYETDINMLLGFVFLVVALIVATSELLLFLFCFDLGKAPIDPRWLPKSSFTALEDRIAVSYGKFTYRFRD